MDKNKQNIIDLFMNNVKNQSILIDKKHCGSEGHWLENKMGIKHNCYNKPDLFGYEMKKNSPKITFGDFRATEYIFSKRRNILNDVNNWSEDIKFDRTDFFRYFGHKINNRYSWSGCCVPKYNKWNKFGQILLLSKDNDLCIIYSYEKDKREEKSEYPKFLQTNLMIAIWLKNKLERHINNKFNQQGFFICQKIGKTYQQICFGKPFNFEYFISKLQSRIIIFDSGMYEGNSRYYSQFRSSATNFWNQLITEIY